MRFALVLLMLAVTGCASEPIITPAETRQLEVDVNESPTLTQLKSQGVIYSIQSADWGVVVTVGPAFDGLSFDRKTSAMSLVSIVLGEDRGGDHFVIYDYRDRKPIGSWSSSEPGLRLR